MANNARSTRARDMMNRPWTGGPWKCREVGTGVQGESHGFEIFAPEKQGYNRIAGTGMYFHRSAEPDVRLMTASPDLYEALEKAVEYLKWLDDRHVEMVERLEAALNAANPGRSD